MRNKKFKKIFDTPNASFADKLQILKQLYSSDTEQTGKIQKNSQAQQTESKIKPVVSLNCFTNAKVPA
jgi:hypothetical protein